PPPRPDSRQGPGHRPGLATSSVHGSLGISLVEGAHPRGIELLTGIGVGQALQEPGMPPTARLRRLALGEQLVQFGTDGIAVVCDVAVHQAAGMALFAAGQAPDERTVARVVFLDAGFLLDHLWAVEPDTRLASRHQVAAQPGSDAHAAEAADRT